MFHNFYFLTSGKVPVWLIILSFIGLFSCVPQKRVIYFRGASEEVIAHTKNAFTVHPKDVLEIHISSLNPQVSEFFNLKQSGEGLSVYQVSDSGYIYIPVIDSMKVKGLTLKEIQTQLQQTIRLHVTDALVVVKLSNFSVTVLGEVGKPGVLAFSGEELDILKAIGMAGDISDFGDKKKVRLIRKEGEASKFINLDLTQKEMVSSEYFYLQPNDVVYVEPLRAKNFKLNISQVSLFLGLSSLVFLVLNLVKN